MGNKLEVKTAVVTGGGSGIGFATAKRFVSEGAYVFIIGRNKKELDLSLSVVSGGREKGGGGISFKRNCPYIYDTCDY